MSYLRREPSAEDRMAMRGSAFMDIELALHARFLVFRPWYSSFFWISLGNVLMLCCIRKQKEPTSLTFDDVIAGAEEVLAVSADVALKLLAPKPKETEPSSEC